MDKVNQGVHAPWSKLRAMIKGEREDLDREIKGRSTESRLLMLGHDDKQEYIQHYHTKNILKNQYFD